MASLLIGIMLVTSAGFTLGATGADALFFARFGVDFLPYMYMALGVLSFFITLGITALLGRVQQGKLFVMVPIGIALVLVGGWVLLFTKVNAIYPALWLGMAVIDSLINLVVWGLASLMCDTRQIKRLFPLFNTGRILGAVLGGLATSLFVHWMGSEILILVMALTMLIASVLGRALVGQRTKQEPGSRRSRRNQPGLIAEMQKGYTYVRRSELMRLVSVSAILFSILFFSIALPFSKAATAQFVGEDALASFLGIFNAFTTGGAFLVSLFLANRLFARFGIVPMLLVLPVIYTIGFGMLAVNAAFTAIVAFRFINMLWLTGVASSAWQAMFNPVPIQRRAQVQAFINGVPSQAGTFIAGAILLVGEQAFLPEQLYLVGLVTAVGTCYTIWRASRAYKHALVEALQLGRPTLFTAEGANIDVFHQDATTVDVALHGMAHTDPLVRRSSAEILGYLDEPRAQEALLAALGDSNSEVKVASLKSLARMDASSAILEVLALLNDADPGVRAQAIDTLCTLTQHSHALRDHLEPMLADRDGFVRSRAALELMKIGSHPEAHDLLRSMAVTGEQDDRIHAIQALAERGDIDDLPLLEREIMDQSAPSPIRRAAAISLGSFGSEASMVLLDSLSDSDLGVREGVVIGLSSIGPQTLDGVFTKLADPASEDGALQVLERFPPQQFAEKLRAFAQNRISSALRYHDLWRSTDAHAGDGHLQLLTESLHDRACTDSLNAIKALGLLNDRDAIYVAVDNLKSRNSNQLAYAIETLETVRDASLIRPMLDIWEPLGTPQGKHPVDEIIVDLLESETDGWLRACAAFASDPASNPELYDILSHMAQTDSDDFVRQVATSSLGNGEQMNTPASLSIMERILLLRRVSLLADLSPVDLQRVAALTSEQHYLDGEIIFEQDEPGDEMYVIASGEVRVLVKHEDHENVEVARRIPGEPVGEMSLISGDLRSASLVAVGDVHLLCLDQKSFEGLLRERPEVSLAVMRMLCARLKRATHHDDAHHF